MPQQRRLQWESVTTGGCDWRWLGGVYQAGITVAVCLLLLGRRSGSVSGSGGGGVTTDRPYLCGVISGTGGEMADVGGEKDAGDVFSVSLEFCDGDEGG